MRETRVILVPTFDRYRWLADLTEALLDRWWPGHPPVYRCGCAQARGPRDLPLRDDPRDWMGIALSAVRDLASQGCDALYLVLDDHPPLGRCHEQHLNETIPRWLDELQAAYIGLNGWGQGRFHGGEQRDPTRMDLQRVAADAKWRFSLHPGLWRREALQELLESLTRQAELSSRSAWAFERRAGETPDGAAGRWSEHTYRVCGRRMAHPEYRQRRRSLLWSLRRASGAAHGLAELLHWTAGQEAVTQRALWLYRDYVGPYPMYHSGLMAGGRPNRRLLRYLRAFGEPELLSRFEAAGRAAGVWPEERSP